MFADRLTPQGLWLSLACWTGGMKNPGSAGDQHGIPPARLNHPLMFQTDLVQSVYSTAQFFPFVSIQTQQHWDSSQCFFMLYPPTIEIRYCSAYFSDVVSTTDKCMNPITNGKAVPHFALGITFFPFLHCWSKGVVLIALGTVVQLSAFHDLLHSSSSFNSRA